MKQYQFKTNINCGGCIATITPFLNANDAIKNWSVDTQNPNKILKVDAEQLTPEAISNIVKQAGFKAEIMQQQ